MIGDLTTLANVNAWCNYTTTNVDRDKITTRTISQVSQVVRSYLRRQSLLLTSYAETYDGNNVDTMLLRQWPVSSVSALAIGAQSIVPGTYGLNGTPSQMGYFFDQWDGQPPGRMSRLSLLGYAFCQGTSNVSVTYRAGYAIFNEAQTVPGTPYQITPAAPLGSWAADNGVTYAGTGVALQAIASGTPSLGQYVPPQPYASSVVPYYQFSAADQNANVLLTYSFTPADLEQAIIEMIQERLSYRARPGERTHSTGGVVTASFNIVDLTPWIKLVLEPYRRKVPV
jgi:hypothetical protein